MICVTNMGHDRMDNNAVEEKGDNNAIKEDGDEDQSVFVVEPEEKSIRNSYKVEKKNDIFRDDEEMEDKLRRIVESVLLKQQEEKGEETGLQ